MVLFGGKFCTRIDTDGLTRLCTCAEQTNPNVTCVCSRKNFDTFVQASLTVFQVIQNCQLKL